MEPIFLVCAWIWFFFLIRASGMEKMLNRYESDWFQLETYGIHIPINNRHFQNGNWISFVFFFSFYFSRSFISIIYSRLFVLFFFVFCIKMSWIQITREQNNGLVVYLFLTYLHWTNMSFNMFIDLFLLLVVWFFVYLILSLFLLVQ